MLRPDQSRALVMDPTFRRRGAYPWSFRTGGHPSDTSTWLDAEGAI